MLWEREFPSTHILNVPALDYGLLKLSINMRKKRHVLADGVIRMAFLSGERLPFSKASHQATFLAYSLQKYP